MISFASSVLIIKLVGIILIISSLFLVYKCSDPKIVCTVSNGMFTTLIVLCSIGLIVGYLLLTIEYWRVFVT